jgi:hypothetical protein
MGILHYAHNTAYEFKNDVSDNDDYTKIDIPILFIHGALDNTVLVESTQ